MLIKYIRIKTFKFVVNSNEIVFQFRKSSHDNNLDSWDNLLGAIGGRPDLLPATSTPPPTFAEALADGQKERLASAAAGATIQRHTRVSTTTTRSS